MMSKITAWSKGKDFEREIAKTFPKYGKRVVGSGAIGTLTGITQLMGDVSLVFPWFSKKLLVEAKHGYANNAEKSITLKKEWFEKIKMEAAKANAIPCLAFKFKQVPNSRYIAFHMDDFKLLMEDLENLYEEVELLRDQVYTKEIKGASK